MTWLLPSLLTNHSFYCQARYQASTLNKEKVIRKRHKGRDRRPREQYRVNRRIRVPQVRVVLEDGEQLGVLSRDEALDEAQKRGLDLVEITARANPPVCKIMDYGRFKYEQAKKAKEAKRHSSSMELKEIKFRPKIEQHDLDFKVKHVRRFLEEGNKCRLVVVFRGREVTHPKTGIAVLERVIDAVEDVGSVETRPNLEGKRMFMILGPKAGVVRRAKARPKPTKEASKTAKDGTDKDKGAKPEKKEAVVASPVKEATLSSEAKPAAVSS